MFSIFRSIKKHTKYLILVTFFIGISMWSQISLFISGIGRDRPITIQTEDKELSQMVKEKTGVYLPYFYISESGKVFGMMASVPGKPLMLISRPLYESFNQDELQFVILHEVGHYTNQHTVKELALSLILLMTGVLILKKVNATRKSIILSVTIGSLLALLALQYGKLNEYESDEYAITRMDDPQGAIQAAYRFKEAYSQPAKETLIQTLFFRRVPYYKRIEEAKNEIRNREQ